MKHLAIAEKCMKDGQSFIKDVEITNGKAHTIYSVISNEIEECGAAKSSRFGSEMGQV